MMLANPKVADSDGPPEPDGSPGLDEERAERLSQLKGHGFNPLLLGSMEVAFDLKTDSWAQLDTLAIRSRMGELVVRASLGADDLEARLEALFPFEHVLPTLSGRAAEELFWASWPDCGTGAGTVLQNLLFPTHLMRQIEHGFEALELPCPEIFDLSSQALFRGGVDVEALVEHLGQHQVVLACLEVSNNGAGGYPIDLENLESVKGALAGAGVPLLIDATRILENALFIEQHSGEDPWQTVREICGVADILTASLAKDFAVNLGGVVCCNDARLDQEMRRRARERRLEPDGTQRKFLAQALADKDHALDQARRRMAAADAMRGRLAAAGLPVAGLSGGHCVLLSVRALEAFRELPEPVPSFLAWLYLETGIRGGGHLVGLQKESPLNGLVRLAVPLGTTREQALAMAEAIAGAFEAGPEPLSLQRVRRGDGFGGEARSTYQLADVEPQAAAPPTASPPAAYPLTKGQEGIWFLCRLAPEAYAYNIPFAFHASRETDPAKLRRAFQQLQDRHPALRTVFPEIDGQPCQVVQEHLESCFQVQDLGHLERHDVVEHLLKTTRIPFDLEAGSLLRVFFFHCGHRRPVLLINVHHLIFDGASYDVLIDELLEIYGAEVTGKNHDLPPVVGNFADFEAWQREMLASPRGESLLAWWRERLADAPRQLDLATDFPRPETQSFAGDTFEVELDRSFVTELRALARRLATNPFSLCLAGFGMLLARQARQPEVVIGTAVRGRTDGRWGGIIGFFVNMLPVRIDLAGNRRLDAYLKEVQKAVFDLLEHADLPFPSLVKALEFSPERQRTALFQASFIWHNLRARLEQEYGPGRDRHALALEPVAGVHQVGEIELSLEVLDLEERLCLIFKYDPTVFHLRRIRRMAEQYQVLLSSFSTDLERKVFDLPLLPGPERYQILNGFNDTAVAGPTPSLQAAFAAAAETFAEASALSHGDHALSYRALDRRTNRLAHHLRDLGVGPDVLVGISMRRSMAMIEAMLAVIKAGGAWVPLDPTYPEERLRTMVESASPRLVLADSIATGSPAREGDIAAAASLAARRLVPSALDERLAAESDGPLEERASAMNLLYVIYTSGSTGKPKGIAMSRGTIANLIRWQIGLESFAPRLRTVQLASVNFDISTQELFETWLTGGEVVLVDEDLRRDANALLSFIAARRIERMHQPFVGMQALAASFADGGPVPACLREVTTAGEQLQSTRQLRAFFCALPGCSFHNHYGPSEAHVITAFDLPAESARWPALPPVGRAISRTRIYLLDPYARPVPIGVPGELYVGGANLARGYLGRAALTAERFLPDPFAADSGAGPGERLYRTGDLARYDIGEQIEFLGRIDFQVKVRGYRIELGEIETLLNRQETVREAAVVVHQQASGDRRLVAFVVPASLGELEVGGAAMRERLTARLAARLPPYMVPAAIVLLPRMPVATSSKLDRKALERRAAEVAAPASDRRIAPRTTEEELLCSIWAEVLSLDPVAIGIDSHFFELGGHSLTATRLCALVRKTFGVEVPVGEVFARPTVVALAARLPELASQEEALEPPEPRPRPDLLPLSFAQERLWFLERREGPSATYNLPAAFRLEGTLDAGALSRALAAVVDRHESLRTHFADSPATGRARQVVEPPGGFSLPVVDLSGLPRAVAEKTTAALVDSDAAIPFDLDCGPLFRACLLRLRRDLHALAVNMHHAVSDGWSLGVLNRELTVFYQAFWQSADADLSAAASPLPVQYADFTLWQRERLQAGALTGQLDYWTRQLSGAPEVLELPTSRPRLATQTFRGSLEAFRLSPRLTEGLRRLAAATRGTLFLVLEASLAELLGRYSGAREVLVGTPVANRRFAELEPLIGFFVNTLALRNVVGGGDAVRERIAAVRDTVLGALAHQDLPFERLVEALNPVRDPSRSPLCQVMFSLQNTPAPDLELEAVTARHMLFKYEVAKVDLTLYMVEAEGGFDAGIEYNRDLFDRSMIRRMVGQLRVLLEGFAARPDAKVRQLPWLSTVERFQVLRGFNDTLQQALADPLAATEPVHRRFRDHAGRRPDAVAVVLGGEVLTYRELDRRSDQLARHLVDLGLASGDRVGLIFRRGLELVTSAVAVLKTGATCAALDPKSPAERLRFMLEDAACRLVLTTAELSDSLPADSIGGPVQVLLDRDRPAIESARGRLPDGEPLPAACAYVIFTSGSTGRPKGTGVFHHSLAEFIEWNHRAFELTAEDRIGMLAGPGFDASPWEIWNGLCLGASLAIVPDDALAPEVLPELINRHRVTWSFMATPLVELMARTQTLSRIRTLRTLLTGGDRLLIRPAADLAFPLRNVYGPTECTMIVTAGKVSSEGPGLPPIGRPLAASRVQLLDPHLEPVPQEVAGEICLGGTCVGPGYLHRAGLTAQKFVPDAFAARPGQRLYKTGDLARWRSDGKLTYLSRIDHQVQIRGLRVELGEIEAQLTRHPAVAAGCVVFEEAADGGRLLAAVSAKGERPTASALRDFLAESLPPHMIPAAIAVVDRLPLTVNGKHDRAACSRLAAAESEWRQESEGGERWALRTTEEELLADLWAEVLALDPSNLHPRSDFFGLGGHSLSATSLTALVRQTFGVELPLREVFARPTIGALASYLPSLRHQGPALAPPRPLPRTPPLPMSFAQERLWILDRLEGPSATYNVPLALRLEGELHVAALERALGEIVRRHESLRTRFTVLEGEDSTVTQRIEPPGDFPLPWVDLSGLAAAAAEDRAMALAQRDAVAPFDLDQDPLVRASLLRLRGEVHVLLLNMHHIISDGWSFGVLHRELAAFYQAFRAGVDPATAAPPLAVQYPDYALWQRDWLQGEALEDQLGFWLRELEGAPEALDLPLRGPRPRAQTYRGTLEGFRLNGELTRGLRRLAAATRGTLFLVLEAAFAELLGRYSGVRDVCVGTPVANRRFAELEPLIGCFVNTLVLRNGLEDGDTVRERIDTLRGTVLDAFAHQDLPFERLVEVLNPVRDASRSPIFQVLMVLQNASMPALELKGLTVKELPWHGTVAKFDLTLYLKEDGDGLAAGLEYNVDLFDASLIRRMARQLRTLLESFAAYPDGGIQDLSLLSAAERFQMLGEWNDTAVRRRPWPGLHCGFEEQARRSPQAVALVHGGAPTTYGELASRADQLAAGLLEKGVGRETRVAILLPRTPALIAGLLGILKTGGTYVPLDPAYPRERLEFMLEDAGAFVLVTSREALAASALKPTCEILFEEDLTPAAPVPLPEVVLDPRQLAYLIYTSGSTGRPKAVAIEHRSATALLDWARTVFSSSDLRGVPAVSSVCFDLSVFEIFLPLSAGGTVYLADDALAIQDLSGRERLTMIQTVPSVAAELARAQAVPPGVKVFVLAGEPLPGELVRALYAIPSVERVCDLYGASEDTTHSTYTLRRAGGPRTVGRPFDHRRLLLLGAALRPVPAGAVGEVHLGGAGLARCYLHRPRLTAERFVPDPYSGQAGERIYRTGDLGRFHENGEIRILGRLDHQVKIRGFRIEVGEIEAQLSRHEGVEEACALVDETEAGKYLIGAIRGGGVGAVGEPSANELQSFLAGSLPDYMIPPVLLSFEELPKSPNGKIDRRTLLRMAREALRSHQNATARALEAPRDPVEELLVGLWTSLLPVDELGIHDNFFALGGHSLLATQVVSRILADFHVKLPMRAIFEQPTVAALARCLGESLRQTPSASLVEEKSLAPERPATLPLSWAQYRLWFLDRFEEGAASNLNMHSALRWRGALEPEALRAALNLLPARHEILRTTFPVRDDGEPCQRIAPRVEIDLPLIDLSRLEAPDREAQVRRRQIESGRHLFDLLRAPLLRVSLLRLKARDSETQDHVLLQCVHHIVSDGWSMSLMLREVLTAYLALIRDQEPSLPPLPRQYADHAVAQRLRLEGETGRVELDWWRETLKAPPSALDLPTDHRRPPVASHRGEMVLHNLDAGLGGDLHRLARERGATLFMVLLATFKVVLWRLSGERDMLVGTPIAGRQRAEVENLLGCFLNTLVLRTRFDSRSDAPTSFEDILEQVREHALGAYAHQELPFERILEEIAPERDPSRTPLFQVFFNMLNLPPVESGGLLQDAGFEIELLDPPEVESKFDLTFYLSEHEAGTVALHLVYRRDLFSRERMAEMARQFELVLRQIAGDPAIAIDRISLLSEPARRALGELPSPHSDAFVGSVPELFLRRASDYPEKVALCDPQVTLSYARVAQESGELARQLRRLGVGPGKEQVVAILAQRNVALAIAVVGVLRAGAVVTILDPALPTARRAQILRLAQPRVLVEMIDHRLQVRSLKAAQACDAPTDQLLGANDPAVLTFTSGSTGVPKGVIGLHGPLTHFLPWQAEHFQLDAHARGSVLSGLMHDPLQRDLFTPLYLGAACVFPDPERRLEPGYLAGWMAQQRLTLSNLTPALGQLICEHARETLPAMRCVFLVGEALAQRDAEALHALAPDGQVVNLYGSTETQRALSFHLAAAGSGNQLEILPLGRGMQGVDLLVLNVAGSLAGIGELGEVHVRSSHLARGYLGDSALTAQRFVPSPFVQDQGERLYRSGDLGRYLPSGEVAFVGRADRQVQVRGFRVELGEIEAALARHPKVEQVAVLPRGQTLVAFLTRRLESASIGPMEANIDRELRAWLGERLPAYMVPAAFHHLGALPLTSSAKVDRLALVRLAAQTTPTSATFEPPQTPMEELLAEIWSGLLDVSRVGRKESFFALGGHSLLATRLAARVRQITGHGLTLRGIFENSHLDELAAHLDAGGSRHGDIEPFAPRPEELHEPFALTDIQEAYWVGRQAGMEFGAVASQRFLEFDVRNFDLPRAIAVWQRMIARHDMLRAVVLADGRQRILPEVPTYSPELVDLRVVPAVEQERAMAQLRQRSAHEVFDLEIWPLFAVRAAQLGERHYRLFLSLDFMIVDASSFRILVREAAQHYLCLDHPLPALEFSFRDYVLALELLRRSELYQHSLDYWRERLADLPGGPELPLRCKLAELEQPRFARRRLQLDAAAWRRLKEHGRAHGLSPAGLLLAAFATILATWSPSRRFSMVLTLFNTLPFHPHVNRLVGDFTSTTLLVLEVRSGESFVERARRCQLQLWSDLDHRYVSGVQVARELARRSGTRAKAISPIIFTSTLDLPAWQQAGTLPEPEIDLPRGEMVDSLSQTPQVLLDHQVSEDEGGLHLNWDVVADAFPEGMVDAMFHAYEGLLRGLAEPGCAWDEPLRGILARAPGGAAQLAARALANAAVDDPAVLLDADGRALLHRPILEAAASRAAHPAVITPGLTLSHGELAAAVHAVSRTLREHEVGRYGGRRGRPELVAVVMNKGWEQVVAVLAVQQAGSAYLPIDPALPAERRGWLLQSGRVRVVITQPVWTTEFEWPSDVAVLGIDTDLLARSMEAADATATNTSQTDDLAYVIFTSGSTGVPKGVMIEHSAARNTIDDLNQRFHVGPRDRVLALSSLSFDLSVYDIFGLLAAGGSMVLPPPDARRDPEAWINCVRGARVTIWNTVPALMEMFLAALEARCEAWPESLRLVMLSGDWIPVDLPGRIRSLAGSERSDLEIYSLGGATEASIWSILYQVQEVDPSWTSIPYGKPLRGQSFHVLDEAFGPVPAGVPGQLFIGGVGLARGYWDDSERTAASFPTQAGQRLYATGDLGRYLDDGQTLEFLGRIDFQVKVQGYRIELGEIEAALLRHPEVRAAVVAAPGARSERYLAAYVVAEPAADVAAEPACDLPVRDLHERLRDALAETLPGYMVPAVFIRLDALPLTANGKIDRQSLPDPESARQTRGEQAFSTAQGSVEQDIAQLFAEILNLPSAESIDRNTDFFSLGGNSVMAIRLVSRLRERLDVAYELRHFFDNPTIVGLAAMSEQGVAADRTCSPLQVVRPGSAAAAPPFFCVHPAGGTVFCYGDLARHLALPGTFYGLQSPGLEDAEQLLTTIESMAEHYLQALRVVQPAGPYFLGGWSMGAMIAYEIACQLRSAGEDIAVLAMVDSGPESLMDVAEGDIAIHFLKDLELSSAEHEQWCALPEDQFLRRVWKRGRELKLMSPELDFASMQRFFRLYQNNLAALETFSPRALDRSITLFTARASETSTDDLGWSQLGVEVARRIEVPGDHQQIMREPSVRVLALELRKALRTIERP